MRRPTTNFDRKERPMFTGIRRHFTYTNLAATLAVFFALSGGALAAGHYLITSTKQIKPSVLSALKGKAGAQGAAGPAGAQGPAGPAGAKGETGATGPQGPEGKAGAPGANGKEGEPWTAGGTLPSGKTLKGEWNISGTATGANALMAGSVSFALPLKEAPVKHYIRVEEAPPAGCTGSAEDPGAAKGNLCIFASQEENALHEFINRLPLPGVCALEKPGECLANSLENTASPLGFGIETFSEEAGFVFVKGSWAVTAE
jgi:hypothetical protein